MRSLRLALAGYGLAALLGCANAPIQAQLIQPEGASGYTEKRGVATTKFAVAAANPLATEAGYRILKAGGSAVDAAVAVQMVLGLVEPQSSGIGGGAFLLYRDSSQKCSPARPELVKGQAPCGLQAYDGRETAPALATENLFINADGKPMALMDAVVGGRSVGTLGVVKMLELAHQQHGKLPWAKLFEPAIDLATNGFAVSPRMGTLLALEVHLKKDPVALAYFYDQSGQPWPAGHLLKNPEYAEVLKLIARDGAKALHEGDIAEAIVRKVQSHSTNAGTLSMQDLAHYTPKTRTAFCTAYAVRQKQYVMCGMPPPGSGAITIAQILGMMNAQSASLDADFLHPYLEASRLAFADRAQYIADPDFASPPAGDWRSLIAADYLLSRAQLIGERSMKIAKAGEPRGARLSSYAPMPDQVEQGTSHISIVDADGNALAMTSTIESVWGSRLMVNRGRGAVDGKPLLGGFLLNNQLTDFSFAPRGADGKPIANRVEAGKRPRSSMSPTLVFDGATGALVASVGSPGGAFITHFTAKTLYGMLIWGLNAQEAINLPNFGSLNGPTFLEKARFPASTIESLKARGHEVIEVPLPSGLQGIQTTSSGFFGGADPRREGIVLGD
ncbi:MAG: gamma-glutamyltransferase family protein [Cytophagales bacterium]|nr:gamma-glutamyltransferase family protein [Cytophagales bacterium]